MCVSHSSSFSSTLLSLNSDQTLVVTLLVLMGLAGLLQFSGISDIRSQIRY